MKLDLVREQITPKSSAGRLFIDGVFECYTLEDTVREVPGKPVSEWKIPKVTAIPTGTYKVDITPSARYRRDMPIVLDVPGFTGIRIHSGNTDADTEGCILVGAYRESADEIRGSRAAFGWLFEKLLAAKARAEEIWIAVTIALEAHG
jgi:hypothetical protein